MRFDSSSMSINQRLKILMLTLPRTVNWDTYSIICLFKGMFFLLIVTVGWQLLRVFSISSSRCTHLGKRWKFIKFCSGYIYTTIDWMTNEYLNWYLHILEWLIYINFVGRAQGQPCWRKPHPSVGKRIIESSHITDLTSPCKFILRNSKALISHSVEPCCGGWIIPFYGPTNR